MASEDSSREPRSEDSGDLPPGQVSTGRYIVRFDPSAVPETTQALAAHGLTPLSGADAGARALGLPEAGALVLPTLGLAVVRADPEQLQRLMANAPRSLLRYRPERIFRISGGSAHTRFPDVPDDRLMVSTEYLRGYQAAINALVESLTSAPPDGAEAASAASVFDEAQYTWGLQITGVRDSAYTGKGVRVAVLDTGWDPDHPDFRDRGIQDATFVPETADARDDHGHGTHCLGTVFGPKSPSQAPRYGVAPDAELFVGKVLNAFGEGKEGWILQGIQWALDQRCRVISLSLGGAVRRGEPADPDYENLGLFARRANCLLIAAAGNDSRRPSVIAPVEEPANARSILAVGAIDPRRRVARTSNGGMIPDGGGIDLVAPGVDVLSARRTPRLYGRDDGTSMATPHVAGIAALLAEAHPEATADALVAMLTQAALRLPESSVDVGSGLVQAP